MKKSDDWLADHAEDVMYREARRLFEVERPRVFRLRHVAEAIGLAALLIVSWVFAMVFG